MKKSDRISALVDELRADPASAFDPRYTGFFASFNAQRYYEAHDILEHLWLETHGVDRKFFQGLIQVAGAFVHLQKHFLQPVHPKHASRMRPAARLLALAARKLEPHAPTHLALDVAAVLALCRKVEAAIVASDFSRNPWQPAHAPQLRLSHS